MLIFERENQVNPPESLTQSYFKKLLTPRNPVEFKIGWRNWKSENIQASEMGKCGKKKKLSEAVQ